jgi:hypothetical protein
MPKANKDSSGAGGASAGGGEGKTRAPVKRGMAWSARLLSFLPLHYHELTTSDARVVCVAINADGRSSRYALPSSSAFLANERIPQPLILVSVRSSPLFLLLSRYRLRSLLDQCGTSSSLGS